MKISMGFEHIMWKLVICRFRHLQMKMLGCMWFEPWRYFFFTWAAMEKSNTTFNTISVISWWSVLLLEETRVPGENHQLGTSH